MNRTAFSRNTSISHTAKLWSLVCGDARLGRMPAQVEAAGDHRQHPGQVQLVRGDEGRVAGEEGHGHGVTGSSIRRRTHATTTAMARPSAAPPTAATTKSTLASSSEKLPATAAATATR